MTDSRPNLSRRGFLGGAAGAGALAALSPGIAEAAAEPRRRGRLDDVEHVVVLMQENRSFDHYYGSMRGVRGFGDRAALRLPGGADVFHQPDPARTDGGYLLPFHVDTHRVDGQQLADLDHSWDGTHLAWAGGEYDGWIAAKTEMTMSYFTHHDIPFQRALAAAFTSCDQYFCSIQGPTTPNRLFLWSGMIDPRGTAGGPAIDNPADYAPVYSWTTYPERLQAAGVSWQVYANDEVGDDPSGHPFVGDYGDNPLWLFHAYHDALASSDPTKRQLAARASLNDGWKPDSGLGADVDHVIARFAADCRAGTLPRVSWVVAPYGYCEHPAARPVDGAAYTEGVLRALWDNPRLWESTVVLVDYDENDGFFDHLIPPVAPPGTPEEWVGGRPVGLGPRVPLTVISPWSRGGWVNSQVADHTSVLRFLERWTGVAEPNISAWRRAVCGDLTSCFDFGQADTTIPLLPDTAALRRQADQLDPTLPPPSTPPVGGQVTPEQEPGTAPARPLPYQPVANVVVGPAAVTFDLANTGAAALQVSIYPHRPAGGPQRVDIPAAGRAGGSVPTEPVTGAYEVWLYGPNGFLRHVRGARPDPLEAHLSAAGTRSHPTLRLRLVNSESRTVVATLTDHLSGRRPVTYRIGGHGSRTVLLQPLSGRHGWYDVEVAAAGNGDFTRRFAGHLENGRPSVTG